MPEKKQTDEKKTTKTSYTIEDAIKIADDILKMGKDKKYNIGAFIHGLIFAQEYSQQIYQIPQQQIAIIKRDCRKYFREINPAKKTII